MTVVTLCVGLCGILQLLCTWRIIIIIFLEINTLYTVNNDCFLPHKLSIFRDESRPPPPLSHNDMLSIKFTN